jgi:transposase
MMRFYNQQHPFYCGVDLHAKTLHLCVLDQAGEIVRHRGIRARPEDFLRTIEPYQKEVVVGAECMFAWYWLSDLCLEREIPFVLGHALYMRAIHGSKTKNDKIDSEKIARLLRGGTFPMSYVYPRQMRSTRDLLRRRCFLVRRRGELLAHLNNTFSQYNVTPPPGKFSYAANRVDLTKCFDDASVRRMVQTDVALAAGFDKELTSVELYLKRNAKVHDPDTFHRLKTVPGIGEILAMVLLYEIHDIRRFADVGDFVSYARLVRGSHESAGKSKGSPHKKIGNAHLKWAFSEATTLLMRECEAAKRFVERKAKKHNKPKAMSVLAAKLGRAVYWMLRRKTAFDVNKLFAC